MFFTKADDAIQWIHGDMGLRRKGEKDGLNNMRALLALLGDPQNSFKALHVAGTNGKGSTCAYLESALRHCGYKTGLYTSPYLCRYNERMRVNNVSIPDEALCRLASRVREQVLILAQREIFSTTFEIGTAICFLYFQEEKVDAAVVEVGLGGRFDPTNVILPEVCAIAAIGLDHTGILGDTLAQIAMEKAGVIKPGVPAAVYPVESEAMPPILEAAERNGSELLRTEWIPVRVLREHGRGAEYEGEFPSFGRMRLRLGLIGRHQINNSRLAVAALALLRERGWELPAEAVERGIEATRWAGRLEWIGENTLIDGAHNPQGAASLAAYAREYLRENKTVLVTGMMHDKQIDACAKILAPAFGKVVATKVDYPRAAQTAELRAIYEAEGCLCHEAPDVSRAIALARELAGEGGVVVVAGSLYVAGEARIILTGGEEL
ncbi:MAG: folylpolyglutamate synthase/dihydrofolate synthase family protein [Eubacteriales bacterium]|nr:folylpolyglutamate synthase/dihydrofolate synthase family protein [Eubacteriales bacterium]